MSASQAHVLGIDAGATKTVCLLATEAGETVHTARATGTNLQWTKPDTLERVLGEVMQAAIADHTPQLSAICIGMAGADRDTDFGVVRAMVSRLGHAVPTLVVNDALIALVAGVGEATGVVVVAGTGAIGYGRNADGLAARAGGWGYLLGDEGSGYWIGRRALRAVIRASDGRGAPSSITAGILEQFGVSRAQDLMRVVQTRDLGPAEIAALAAHVQRAAESGDAIASAILSDAAVELAQTAAAVIHRLGLADESFTVVLAGSVFKAAGGLVDGITERLSRVAPLAHTMMLEVEPAVGAVRLAQAVARGALSVPTYAADSPADS